MSKGQWKLTEFYDGKPLFEVAFWTKDDVLDNSDYLALYTDDKIEAEQYLEKCKGERKWNLVKNAIMSGLVTL